MDGRVKTLHPQDPRRACSGGAAPTRRSCAEHGIEPIDLLVVNLYPFAATIARPDCSYAEAIENIDVGGPAMLRAAAKNHADVTVLVDPADYATVLAEIDASGETSIDTRSRLAAKAFAHTAEYDTGVSDYLQRAQQLPIERFPDRAPAGAREGAGAALRRESAPARGLVPRDGRAERLDRRSAQMLQGKELSFNNLAGRRYRDRVRAPVRRARLRDRQARQPLRCRRSAATFGRLRARATGPIPPRPTAASSPSTVRSMPRPRGDHRPAVRRGDRGAVDRCGGKLAVLQAKPDIRVLAARRSYCAQRRVDYELRSVNGGAAGAGSRHRHAGRRATLRVVTRRAPDERELADLRFAWQVVRFVKSNAIVFARDGATIGVGAGQMSRVYSTPRRRAQGRGRKTRAARRGHGLRRVLARFATASMSRRSYGISADHPAGRLQARREVIEAADAHGMAMVYTGMRHFRH